MNNLTTIWKPNNVCIYVIMLHLHPYLLAFRHCIGFGSYSFRILLYSIIFMVPSGQRNCHNLHFHYLYLFEFSLSLLLLIHYCNQFSLSTAPPSIFELILCVCGCTRVLITSLRLWLSNIQLFLTQNFFWKIKFE